MDPADSNISLVEKVTPFTHVDNYAGAQKLMDAYLIPGSYIKLRYYLKIHFRPEFFKIRITFPDIPDRKNGKNPEFLFKLQISHHIKSLLKKQSFNIL